MNEFDFLKSERKNQTLVLVEGEHEKKTLLSILLTCFPEIPILAENIHVYAADIYDLYHDIEKEYDEDWYESDLEIDIPMLISRRYNIEPQLNKKNFTNIILMFDYEHHDTWFSDEKIQRMQEHFNSISDDGILYISYPMIEAYKHIVDIPDLAYLDRVVSIRCQPGKKYKQIVEEYSVVDKYFKAYDDLLRYLKDNIKAYQSKEIEPLIYNIYSVREIEKLKVHISDLLFEFDINEKKRVNMENSITKELVNLGYLNEGLNYWEKLRQIFIYIIEVNIEKAVKIQRAVETMENLKDKYLHIDWSKVLDEQNKASSDNQVGIIWVLCTCVTFLAEYKFYWDLIS